MKQKPSNYETNLNIITNTLSINGFKHKIQAIYNMELSDKVVKLLFCNAVIDVADAPRSYIPFNQTPELIHGFVNKGLIPLFKGLFSYKNKYICYYANSNEFFVYSKDTPSDTTNWKTIDSNAYIRPVQAGEMQYHDQIEDIYNEYAILEKMFIESIPNNKNFIKFLKKNNHEKNKKSKSFFKKKLAPVKLVYTTTLLFNDFQSKIQIEIEDAIKTKAMQLLQQNLMDAVNIIQGDHAYD